MDSEDFDRDEFRDSIMRQLIREGHVDQCDRLVYADPEKKCTCRQMFAGKAKDATKAEVERSILQMSCTLPGGTVIRVASNCTAVEARAISRAFPAFAVECGAEGVKT